MVLRFLDKLSKNEGVQKNIVGAVIVNNANEVFVAQRKKDDFMGGFYEIPGGNSEVAETILDTLKREVKEETNLEIEKVEEYINYFDYLSSSGKKCRQFNFKVKVKKGDIILTEHDNYKWLPLDKIEELELMSKEIKNCLQIYKFNFEQNKK